MVCYMYQGKITRWRSQLPNIRQTDIKKIITRIRVPNDEIPTPDTGAHWPCFAKEMWSPARSSLERLRTVSIPRTRYKSETVGTPLQWTSNFLPETTCYRPIWTPPCTLVTIRYTDLPTLSKLHLFRQIKMATKFPRRFKNSPTYVWLRNSGSS
jgi:hypothetical protein